MVRVVLLAAYLYGVVAVMRPFLQPVAWAMVLVACAWPLHCFLRRTVARNSDWISAAISTSIMALLIIGILVPLSFEITNESKRLVSALQTALVDTAAFDSFISKFPGLPKFLQATLSDGSEPREALIAFFNEHQSELLSGVSIAAKGLGQLLFGIGVTVFTSFFLFRYGENLAHQIYSVAGHFGGPGYQHALTITWVTIGAVMYGVAVAAVIQGLLAGIGFYIFGAPLPLLFGGITVLLGLIPFGPPILYLPMSGYLIYSGAPWYIGVGLALWGISLVSTADNIFRPLFISRATSLPVLFAFFGGLGGIAAFGMIGLFIGPILLALAQEFWGQLLQTAKKDA
jgi:predicted PurR-regulated permease PerM